MLTNAYLQDDGKEVALDAVAVVAVRLALYDENEIEVSGGGYERQAIAWESAVGSELEASTGEYEVVAEFSVPEGTIRYAKLHNTDGDKTYASGEFDEPVVFLAGGVLSITSLTITINN